MAVLYGVEVVLHALRDRYAAEDPPGEGDPLAEVAMASAEASPARQSASRRAAAE